MFGFLSLLCRDLQAVPWEARVFELGARIGRARKGPRLFRPFVILERIRGVRACAHLVSRQDLLSLLFPDLWGLQEGELDSQASHYLMDPRGGEECN